MIYFSFFEILRGVLSFILLGIIFAILRRAARILFENVGYIMRCIPLIFERPSDVRMMVKSFFINRPADSKYSNANLSLSENLFDFVFTLLFSVAFFIVAYITFDGIIRLFAVILAAASFFAFSASSNAALF